MAGPSLSHILETPRIPTSTSGGGGGGDGLERYITLPSITTRDEPLPRNHTYSNSSSNRIPTTTTVVLPNHGATAGPSRVPAAEPALTPPKPTALPSLTAHHAHHDHHPQHAHQSVGRADVLPSPASATGPLSHQSPALAPATPASNATSGTPNASQSNHRGNNLYACRDCGRSYSRPEHLVRHVQTHTLGRRFVCDVCQKSFARKDLLRRHVANHDNDSPKKRRRTTTSPGAGRVSHACRSCAVARVKCDDTKPCKRCLSRNLNCVSTETPSTAAMHLLHLSASSASSAATAAIATPPTSYNDGDRSVTTAQSSHSTASTRDSISPAPPYVASSHQPRSVTLPAPHSLGLDAAHDRSNSNLPQPFAKLSIQGPRSPDYHLPPIEFEPSTSAMDPHRLPYSDFLRDVLYDGSDSGSHGQGQGLLVLDFCDYENLEFAVEDSGQLEEAPNSRQFENVIPESLSQPSRDRVLAIVLNVGRANPSVHRLAGSFPSLRLMDFLVHRFLASVSRQSYEWIHLPTFRLDMQSPEWIAIAAATAATTSSIPGLRNFGFTLQEAVRASITSQLEEYNSADQDMALLQTLIMAQDIGLWSGNKRKMEIAECYLATPVKMLRHRRKFQGSHYNAGLADASDDGTFLEDKWRKWVDREKWKRLVFHCFVRDAQCSMATLTSPTISYAELALPLPESRSLWAATTATEWKVACLQGHTDRLGKVPSVGDLIQDCQLLRSRYWQLDIRFSISIYLHGYWSLVLEHGQLSALHRSRSGSGGSVTGNQGLLLDSRHQELVKELQSFHLMSAEWAEMSCQDHMLLNVLLMNLHVSLDDIQLFTGKEGDEEARRALIMLQHWATTTKARSSIWYAGQVLRYARSMAQGQLKDFYAIAVHHAAIVLWAYGVVRAASRRQRSISPNQSAETILLDDLESSSHVRNFIEFGHGRPVIRDVRGSTILSESAIESPKGTSTIAQEVLRANFDDAANVPAAVYNVCQVLKQLGDATWAAGVGS